MAPPYVWLASDGFTGQRIVATRWDEGVPLPSRRARAAAPAAWEQLAPLL